MSFVVARVEPIKRKNIFAVARHNERLGELQLHVDKEKSFYNLTLIGESDLASDLLDDISGCDMARKSGEAGEDSVAAELILSFSPEWLGIENGIKKDDIEILNGDSRFKQWIDRSVKFLYERGCIHADLHMDEKTPHIHAIMSVKVKRESKAKTEKSKRRSKKSEYVLNYKSLYGAKDNIEFQLSRAAKNPKILADLEKKYGRKYNPAETKLGQLQEQYANIMSDLGLEKGISVLDTHARHTTKAQWEQKRKKEELEEKHKKEIQELEEKHRIKINNIKLEYEEMQQEKENQLILLTQEKLKLEKDLQKEREESSKIIETEKQKIFNETQEELSKYKENLLKERDQLIATKGAEIEQETKEIENLMAEKVETLKQFKSEYKSILDRMKSRIQGFINKLQDTLKYTFEKLGDFINFNPIRDKILSDTRFKISKRFISEKNKMGVILKNADDEVKKVDVKIDVYEKKLNKMENNYINMDM